MRPPPPLVENAGDAEDVDFATRIEQEDYRAELKLWRDQLETYEGRQFVWLVLSKLPGTTDIDGETTWVFRQLGRRSVWLELYEWIDRHPEKAAQMQQEGLARDRARVKTITAERARKHQARREESPV